MIKGVRNYLWRVKQQNKLISYWLVRFFALPVRLLFAETPTAISGIDITQRGETSERLKSPSFKDFSRACLQRTFWESAMSFTMIEQPLSSENCLLESSQNVSTPIPEADHRGMPGVGTSQRQIASRPFCYVSFFYRDRSQSPGQRLWD